MDKKGVRPRRRGRAEARMIGRNTARRTAAAVACITVAVLLCGCTGAVRHKVEEGIAESLPGIIGPAKAYNVKVSGSTFGMMKGKLDTMQIVGDDVQLSNGLKLRRLTVLSKKIAFDTNKKQLTRADETFFTATLTEAELNRYLRKKYPRVPGLSVELAPNLMRIHASPGAAGVKVQILADAKVQVVDRHLVVLDLQNASVAGVGTPAFAREYVQSKINPVFDAADLGYDAKVDSVCIEKDALSLNGQLDLMAAAANVKTGRK